MGIFDSFKRKKLFKAIKNCDLEKSKSILTSRLDPNFFDEDGVAPMHLAAKDTSSGIYKVLIEAGADPNVQDEMGRTPLMYAVEWGNESDVKALIDVGIDLDIVTKPTYEDVRPDTALCYAVGDPLFHKEFKELKFNILVQSGADPNIALPILLTMEESRVMYATRLVSHTFSLPSRPEEEDRYYQWYEFDIVKLDALLKAGADPNTVKPFTFGSSLLHLAQIKEIGASKLLIEAGADPNLKNEFGDTPLHYAAKRNLRDCIELLINAGADSSVINADGNKPVDLIDSSENCDIQKIFDEEIKASRKPKDQATDITPDCCDLIEKAYITCRECGSKSSIEVNVINRKKGIYFLFPCCNYSVLIPPEVWCQKCEIGGIRKDFESLIVWDPDYR